MAKSQARQVLAENLRALKRAAEIAAGVQELPLRAWAHSLGLDDKAGEMMLTRALKASSGHSLETLEKLAQVFRVPVWQLLIPGMLPPMPDLEPKALELAHLYQQAGKLQQAQIYAITQLIAAGQGPVIGPEPDSDPPAPGVAPMPRRLRHR